MLSIICARYTPASVFYVMCMTSTAFGAMTFYAVTTKNDVTESYSVLYGLSGCFVMFAIIMMFTSSPFIRMLFSLFGVGIGLMYVVMDTQMIMGNRKYGISHEDYIKAALILYLDFIQIFIHLLSLLGDNK